MTAAPASTFYPRVGAVRPSQILYTYGPGSVVDLPQMSVMVAGLDDWRVERSQPIAEDRLLGAVKTELGEQVTELRAAPWLPEDQDAFGDWTRVGIPVTAFPRWLRCTSCNRVGTVDGGLFEPSTNAFRPDWARWEHTNCASRARHPLAVATRFILACDAGHMDDFPWREFAHGYGPVCETPMLEIFEMSPGSTSGDVYVRCGCQQKARSLAAVFGPQARRNLPRCRGRHPHLRTFTSDCGAQVRALLLGASNAWFAITLSGLSIPRHAEPVGQLVERLWGPLSEATTREVLAYMISKQPELASLAGVDLDSLWAAIEARRAGEAVLEAGPTDLRPAEWEVLSDPAHAPSGEDFLIRATAVPRQHQPHLHQVVLAERLREVVAITGMTRVEPPVRDHAGAVRNRAPISREAPRWVPACEVRGEGLFLRLDEDRVAAWEDTAAATRRVEGLRLAHNRWLERRSLDTGGEWPGPRYVLLHTLSHLLIREIALECGYAAASIRERLYSAPAGEGAMAGILLYTAAPDSEGTLGGLVGLGQPETLGRLMSQALLHARLCSSDPLCAHHLPHEDEDVLHGAACHACAFAAETSCERSNRYLDRNLVVETLCESGIAFFA